MPVRTTSNYREFLQLRQVDFDTVNTKIVLRQITITWHLKIENSGSLSSFHSTSDSSEETHQADDV